MWLDIGVKDVPFLATRFLHKVVGLLGGDTRDALPRMTYASAIAYFVMDTLPDPRIKRGVMLLKPHFRGHVFIQAFLDEHNHLVLRPDGTMYGRQLLVRELDEELSELFSGNDYVLVE
jgi:hypothetical protein